MGFHQCTAASSARKKSAVCPGLESNQHAHVGTAPSRQRVYLFRHPGYEGVKRAMAL